MYLIMVYDINEKRVNKVLKVGRKYLNWVQNSVLEGEISNVCFEKMKLELKEIIKEDEDSVIFYLMRTTRYSSREIIGIEKNERDIII